MESMKIDSKIFLSGIPIKVEKREILEFFEKFGKIVNCKLKKNSKSKKSLGYVYLEFEDPEVAKDLLIKPIEFQGRVCMCKPVVKKQQLGTYLLQAKESKLIIENISRDATDKQLNEELRKVTEFSHAYVAKDNNEISSHLNRGFGYIHFNSGLDLKDFIELNPKIYINGILVSFRPPSSKEIHRKKGESIMQENLNNYIPGLKKHGWTDDTSDMSWYLESLQFQSHQSKLQRANIQGCGSWSIPRWPPITISNDPSDYPIRIYSKAGIRSSKPVEIDHPQSNWIDMTHHPINRMENGVRYSKVSLEPLRKTSSITINQSAYSQDESNYRFNIPTFIDSRNIRRNVQGI